MRYRLLGRTGLYVSELCLGTMTFGEKGMFEVIGKLGRSDAEARIGASLDAGVNLPAWLLTRLFVTSGIIGAKTREQLVDNLAATDVTLAPEHIAELDAASALPPEYPGWMVAWQDRNRRPG